MSGLKTIFATQLTDTKTTDVEGVSRVRWEDDTCYRWVYNGTTNFTPSPGNLVCHSFADGATALQNIYQPATANLSFLAGVVIGQFSANTGSEPLLYGWVQIFGELTTGGLNGTTGCVVVTTTATGGSSLKAVNGQVYAVTDTAMGTAPIYHRTIILIDSPATTTTTNVNVFIECI